MRAVRAWRRGVRFEQRGRALSAILGALNTREEGYERDDVVLSLFPYHSSGRRMLISSQQVSRTWEDIVCLLAWLRSELRILTVSIQH